MNQRKANAFIRNRLYLADELFVRSEKEAIALAAQCTISARALVMRAEANSELPAESWSGFYSALDAAERKASGSWHEKLRDAMQSLSRHRRLAIGMMIVALALVFFTLVPAGRAIAEGIFNYVITVFDKNLEIQQTDEKQLYEERGYDVPEVLTQEQLAEYGYDEDGNLIMEKAPIYYDSVAAFEATYSLDAFAFSGDQVTCVEVIENNHIITGKSLRTSYQTANGKTINVIEQWYKGDGQTVSARGEIKEHTVLGNRTMQYVIDSADGTFDGFVLLDNSVLRIYADAGVDIDLIWQLLA